MGVLTDFFIASDDEFASVFRGWKRAAPLLNTPRTFEVINPFTGKPMTGQSRSNPESPQADADAILDPDFHQLPWIDLKGIFPNEIANLAEGLLGWDNQTAQDEVMGRSVSGPKDTEQFVTEMPAELTTRLAELNEKQIQQQGKRWSQRQAEDAMGIQDDGTRNSLLNTPETVWIEVIQELAELAKQAHATNRRMYMWMCT
jgi:hypothetical protein